MSKARLVITAITPVRRQGRRRLQWRRADTFVPVAHGRHTAELIPAATLVVLAGHGHLSIIREIPAARSRSGSRSSVTGARAERRAPIAEFRMTGTSQGAHPIGRLADQARWPVQQSARYAERPVARLLPGRECRRRSYLVIGSASSRLVRLSFGHR